MAHDRKLAEAARAARARATPAETRTQARRTRGAMGASRPQNAALLLDHRCRAQGVPAAAGRTRAVPGLGDQVGCTDQARGLRRFLGPRGGAMSGVTESVLIQASLAETWAY